jgi:hypothetical protein
MWRLFNKIIWTIIFGPKKTAGNTRSNIKIRPHYQGFLSNYMKKYEMDEPYCISEDIMTCRPFLGSELLSALPRRD